MTYENHSEKRVLPLRRCFGSLFSGVQPLPQAIRPSVDSNLSGADGFRYAAPV